MSYRKWVKHLIKKFGRDIRKFALTGALCPCEFFNWHCKGCKYSPNKVNWCSNAEKYYKIFFIDYKEIIILKKKILKRLNK